MKDAQILNEYHYNKRFRDYVDRYRNYHKIPIEEALQHELVKQACLYYTEI